MKILVLFRSRLLLAMMSFALCWVSAVGAAESVLPIPAEFPYLTPREIMLDHLVRWRFRIKEPAIERLDVQLCLGDYALLGQSFTGEMVETAAAVTASAPDLEVTIDFLADIGVAKWRVRCGLRGGPASSLLTIDLPPWMKELDFRCEGWNAPASRRGDRFELANFSYQDGMLRRGLPLALKITLNGAARPRTDPDWTPKRSYAPPPAELSAEAVATAFGWKGELTRREVTDARNLRPRGAVPVWDVSFSAAAGTFCPVSIVAYERGTRLTEDYVAQLMKAEANYAALRLKSRDEQLRAAESIPDPIARRARQSEITVDRDGSESAGVESIELRDGRRAYVQLLAFGPGGASFGFLVPSADGTRDLMLSVGYSHEGETVLKDSPKNHDYFVATREHPMELMKRAGRALFETAVW